MHTMPRCWHLAAMLAISVQTAGAQQTRGACEWHVPQGDAQNVWDNGGLLPGETELPCAGSLAYYEGTYTNTREMCDVEFCPDCEYAHLCDLMCGFSLPADENLYDARMGKGACLDLIVSGQATCDAEFCPACGDFAGYCDSTCGHCTAVNDVHPGSVCVPEFFVAWDVWNSAGCAPTDGLPHCSDECKTMLSQIIVIAEVECADHDLALLPIHSSDPNSEVHVGAWLHGVVLSDEICNPTACSTLLLEADENCVYGTGDDTFEYGCDTTGCVQARQNLETHRFNCTGDRDALVYHGNDFATYTLWLEHECRLCHPGAVMDACSQESDDPDSPCHTECQLEVADFVENRLEDCRDVMLGVGYEHSSIQTIEHIYSVCSGASCVINVPDNAFLGLDADLPCAHTGVLHPGERCQIECDNGFDPEGDGIAECLGQGQVSLDLVCREQDCYQPVVFPAHVRHGTCDVYPLVGALPGEMEVHLARGSSCQPICVDGYVSNGETVDCVTHPSSYGGVLEHNFECHLPCDISDIIAPTRGQLGVICDGTDGTIGFGEVCDLTCEEGFEVSNQPECQGRGDRTHMSSTTATCTAISPTATVTSSMTFHMSISNAEEPGFEQHFKTLLSDEYSEFVGPTSISAIQVTSTQLVGLDSVRANYAVVVTCTPGCDGGSSCRGENCAPATSESVDLRTVPANCFSSRCPLMVGPFPTVDPTLIDPLPVVEIQITLDATMDVVNADRHAFELSFRTSVATILGVARSLIVITAIDPGSVIVSFAVTNGQNAASITRTLQATTIAGYSVVPSPAGPGACTSDNELCQSWAESGQCDTNSGYMQESCALWCSADCATQRPVPVAPVAAAILPGKAPAEPEGGGGGVILLIVLLLLGAGAGAAAFFKLQAGQDKKSLTPQDLDFDSFQEELPKGAVGADGHLQEDDHEDNPLQELQEEDVGEDNPAADFDVEATGRGDDATAVDNPLQEGDTRDENALADFDVEVAGRDDDADVADT